MEFVLEPGRLTLADMARVAAGAVRALRLAPGAWDAADRAHAFVQQALAEGRRTYGVNTGVGPLSGATIPDSQIAELQRRMVLSLCVGTGPLLDDATVRQILLLKLNTLLLGRSGVSRGLIEALLALYNGGVLPCIPAKGSVGASGDLAPLAHLVAPLLGEGEVRVAGEILPAGEGLRRAGIPPYALGPKEGLAIVNGTQVSLALALSALFATENLLAGAIVAGAMTTDAAMGSDGPFDARIQASRGQAGQARIAPIYAELMAGSAIRASHRDCDRVQDPYSLRCQPQIMGACLDLLAFAAETFRREINSVTDNPLVFAEDGEILYGGNFHA
ncbi:MAG: aromatic amino acid lyase, partial [Burkholderiales bacterium]